MADHYRILGVTKNATKNEIKEAFRKLAIKFHPDKHAQSPKPSRDAATLKFKQVSEAYEVLIDDRKRAAYNLSRRYGGAGNGGGGYSYDQARYNANYYYGGGGGGGSYYKASSGRSSSSSQWVSDLDAVFRYMTTRSFLLNLAFVYYLVGQW